jgi:hypothetical protein
MDRLGLFVGTSTCKGALGIPPALSHPIERTIAGKKDIDDFWLFMRFEDARTKENPAPLLANYQIIYNPAHRQFEALWNDNLGRWFVQTSQGWRGDTIAFKGKFRVKNQITAIRDLFIRKSETEMVQKAEMQKNGGEWIPILDLTCRK